MRNEDWSAAAVAQGKEVVLSKTLGQRTTLDLEQLNKLCDNVIERARADLRGPVKG